MAGPTTFTDEPSRLQKLHNFLRKNYEDIPASFPSFEKQMNNPEIAKSVHDMLVEDNVPVPNYDKFSSDLGLKKKDGTEDSGTGATNQSDTNPELQTDQKVITQPDEANVSNTPPSGFPLPDTPQNNTNNITDAETQQVISPVPGGEPFMQMVHDTINRLGHSPMGITTEDEANQKNQTFQQGSYQNETQKYGEAVNKNPSDPTLRYGLAANLLNEGQYGQAADHFEELTKLNVADPKGFWGLGDAMTKMAEQAENGTTITNGFYQDQKPEELYKGALENYKAAMAKLPTFNIPADYALSPEQTGILKQAKALADNVAATYDKLGDTKNAAKYHAMANHAANASIDPTALFQHPEQFGGLGMLMNPVGYMANVAGLGAIEGLKQSKKGIEQLTPEGAMNPENGGVGQNLAEGIGNILSGAVKTVMAGAALTEGGVAFTAGMEAMPESVAKDVVMKPMTTLLNQFGDEADRASWAKTTAEIGDVVANLIAIGYIHKTFTGSLPIEDLIKGEPSQNADEFNRDLWGGGRTGLIVEKVGEHLKNVVRNPDLMKTDPYWRVFRSKNSEMAQKFYNKYGSDGKMPDIEEVPESEPLNTEPPQDPIPPSTEPQPVSTEPQKETASVPVIITNDMVKKLIALKYSGLDIKAMTPQDANDIIDNGIIKEQPKEDKSVFPIYPLEKTPKNGEVEKSEPLAPSGSKIPTEVSKQEEAAQVDMDKSESLGGEATQKLTPRDIAKQKAKEALAEVEPKSPVNLPDNKKNNASYEIDTDQAPVKVPISDISIDKKRFQNRDTDFSEETAKSIAEDFKPHKMNPVVLWEDQKDKKTYILAGHSRLEGFKRRGETTIPGIYAKGLTEEQAIHFATVESNTSATPESDTERTKIYMKKRQSGIEHKVVNKEIRTNERKNAPKIINYSYLNPTGKAFTLLESLQNAEGADNRNNIEKLAEWTGSLRKEYHQLTNKHEDEIFDYLLTEGNKFRGIKEFHDKTKNDIGVISFSPDQPLNIRKKDFRAPIEAEYENNVKELNTQITNAQRQLEAKRKEGLSNGHSGEELDKYIKTNNDELTYLQKQMLTLKSSHGLVYEVAKQPTLFENPFTKEQEKQLKDQTAAIGEELTTEDIKDYEQDIQQPETTENNQNNEKPVQTGLRETNGRNGTTSKAPGNKRAQESAEHPSGAVERPATRELTPNIISDELVAKGLISGDTGDYAMDYLNGEHNAVTEGFYQIAKDAFDKLEKDRVALEQVQGLMSGKLKPKDVFPIKNVEVSQKPIIGATYIRKGATGQLVEKYVLKAVNGKMAIIRGTEDGPDQQDREFPLKDFLATREPILETPKEEVPIEEKEQAAGTSAREQAKQRMKDALRDGLNQMSSGFNAEAFAKIVSAGVEFGYYLVKDGIHEFGEWAKTMVDELGEQVRPYLESIWDSRVPRSMEADRPKLRDIAIDGKEVSVEDPIVITDEHSEMVSPKGLNRVENKAGISAPDLSSPMRSLDKIFDHNPQIEMGAERMSANKQAEEILRQVEAGEKTDLTGDDLRVLAQYSGRGNLTEYGDKSSDYEHFTPLSVINSIYDLYTHAIELGVLHAASNILEPAAGILNFFGALPQGVIDKVSSGDYKLTAVDLPESEALKMARLLYPQVSFFTHHEDTFKGITVPGIKGYIESLKGRTIHDLIITNVPFDANTIMNGHLLHDGFILECLKGLHEGGIFIGITSTGTMDKLDAGARKEMLSSSDFLGAIRLAPGTFKKIADTNVSSDVILLRKRSDKDFIINNAVMQFTGPAKNLIREEEVSDETSSDQLSNRMLSVNKTLEANIRKIAEQFNVDFKTAFKYAKSAIKSQERNDLFSTSSSRPISIGSTNEGKSFIKSAQSRIRSIIDGITDPVIKQDFISTVKQAVDAGGMYGGLSYSFQRHIMPAIQEEMQSKVTESFPLENVIQGNQLYSLIFVNNGSPSYNWERNLFSIIKADDPGIASPIISININKWHWDKSSESNIDVQYTRWGPKPIIKNSRFTDVSKDFAEGLKDRPETDSLNAASALRIGNDAFFPQDGNPEGSLIVLDDSIFRRGKISERTLEEIALSKIKEKFGESVANKAKAFNKGFTLRSLFGESEVKNSKEKRATREVINVPEFLKKNYLALAKDILGDNAVKQADFIKMMGEVYNIAKYSMYNDISDQVKKAGDYAIVIERLKQYDNIIKTQFNTISDIVNQDKNRDIFKKLVSDFLNKNDLNSFMDDPVVSKYLYGKGENKSDNRYYALQALDNLTHDYNGALLPTDKWKGVFKEKVNFNNTHVVKTAGDLVSLMSGVKTEFTTHINVENLLNYVRDNIDDYSKVPSLGEALSEIINSDNAVKDFVDQVTKDGEFMVDYNNTDALSLIRIEDYAIGNIQNHIKSIEDHIEENGLDTPWHNTNIGLDKLREFKNTIPRIPLDVINFSHNQNVVQFKDNVLPFVEKILGRELATKSYYFDALANEAHGSYKFNAFGTNINISGHNLSNQALTEGMLVRWFNNEYEFSPKRDISGKPILDEEGQKIMIPDLELTNERNQYFQKEMNKFFKEEMGDNYKNALHDRYNDQYGVYNKSDKFDEIILNGLVKEFHGKPLVLDIWQKRAFHKAMAQLYGYSNHAVGAGKTITHIMIAVGLKQIGAANKVAIVVPNNAFQQWQDEVKKLFPDLPFKTIQTESKREDIAHISVNNVPLTLIPASTFNDTMQLSAAKQIEYIEKDLQPFYDLRTNLQSEIEAISDKKEKQKLQSQLNKILKVIEKSVKQANDLRARRLTDASNMSADRMGFDALMLDEADHYKNVSTAMTGFENVSGIGSGTSDKAQMMRFFTQFIQEKNHGRNVFYFTGTPVTNSATEIYQALKAVAPKLLEDAGMRTFNDFVAAHGDIRPEETVRINGEIRAIDTFKGLTNPNSLKRLINNVFDVLQQETMNKIFQEKGNPLPIRNNQNHVLPATPEKRIMGYYVIHMSGIISELAKDKEGMKERRDERKKLLIETRQMKEAIKDLEKKAIVTEDIQKLEKYKDTLKRIEANAKALGLNILSLYTSVKGGIVHTKLFHPLIDDSSRSDAKINAVCREAARQLIGDHYKHFPKKKIDRFEYYVVGQDENGKDLLRSVKNGQLFFSDATRRSDLPGFNAQDEYIKTIKSLLPDDIKDKDKLFMKLDSDSNKVVKPAELENTLKKYFAKDSDDFNEAMDYFNNLQEVKEQEPVEVLNEDTGEFEPKLDEDGEPEMREIIIPAGQPTFRDVAKYLYNIGEVRFLFGSTKSMGSAMNLQYTSTANNHIDYPFKPSEYQQRDGRVVRQGNLNNIVDVHNWSSEGGSEILLLQLLHTKLGFINQVWDLDKLDDFTDQDVVSTLQTGETDEKSFLLNQLEQMIANTHDHRIKEYTDDLKKRDKLLNRIALYRSFLSSHESNERRLDNLADDINGFTKRIRQIKAEGFLPKVLEKIEKQIEFDQQFAEAYKQIEENPDFIADRQKIIEKINGYRKKILEEPAPTTEQESEALASRLADLAEIQKRDIEDLRRDKRWYPVREYVPDYSLADKIGMIESLQIMGEKRYLDLANIFFKTDSLLDQQILMAANNSGSGMFNSASIVQTLKTYGKRIPENLVKKLTTKGNFANMLTINRDQHYTLNMIQGLLERAIMTTETSIGNYTNERNKLQETMNSDAYQRTFQDADDNINGSINIVAQIEAITAQIQQNAGVFDSFIRRQKEIATAAGSLVDNAFPTFSHEQRIKAADEFVESIGKFERGEIDQMPDIQPKDTPEPPKHTPEPQGGLFASINTQSSLGNQIAPNLSPPTGKEIKLKSKNKYISASDVAKNMIKNLESQIGTEIRTGFKGARMQRTKGMQGFFLNNNGIIRIKHSLADFSTFAHEMAHALDMGQMGISEDLSSPNATPDQITMKHELLIADLPRIQDIPKYMNASENVRVHEGVAEFIRKYIMNPGQARKECPMFYDFFEKVIEAVAGNDLANVGIALKTARNDWAKYESPDALSKVMSVMAKDVDGGIKTFIQEFWSNPRRFIKKWVNYYELAIFDDRYVERNLLQSYFYELQKSLTTEQKMQLDILQKNIRYTINLINGNGGQIKAFIEHHPFTITSDNGLLSDPDVHVEWSNSPSLFAIEKPFIDEGKVNELEGYLLAKRILHYYDLGLLRENGLPAIDKSVENYKKVVVDTEKEFGEIRMQKVVNDLQEHNRMLFKYLKDSGRYSEDEIQAIVESHPIYIPLLSDISADEGHGEQLPTVGDAGLKPTNPVKNISPLDLKDLDQMDKPLDALITNAMALIKSANENRHLWSLVKYFHEIGHQTIQRIPDKVSIIQSYDQFGEPVFRMKSKDPATEGMCIIRVFNPKEAYGIDGGLISNGGTKVLKLDDDAVRPYQTEEDGFFNKTIPQYYQIPEDLYNYLSYRDKYQKFGNAINQSPVGKILGGINQALRNGAVNLNISWVINNLFRDYGGATMSSEHLHTPRDLATVFPDLMKEMLTGKLSADQWLALAAGADMRGLFNIKEERKRNFNLVHQNKVIHGINKTFNIFNDEHFLRRLGQMSEQFNRYSAFKKSLANGKTVTEAANEQRTITADFSIAGAWSKLFNKIFYFLTASLAWTHLERDIIAKFIRGDKDVRKRLAIVMGAWTGVELLFWWLNNYTPWTNDPEERRKHRVAYYALPAWQRNGFYALPTGNGHFVPVPKGFFQIVFGGILKLGLEASSEENRDKLADWVNSSNANYFYDKPSDISTMAGSLIPGQIRPFVEYKANYNFFKDKNIIPPNLENQIPERQYFPWTPNIYKSIGRHTGLSPIKIQTLAEEYGASITKFGAKIASEVTSGHISDQSSSFMDDMGSIFLPQQFDKSIEYLANRSQAGQDFLQFNKDIKVKENSFKKFYKEWTDAVTEGDESRANLLKESMDRLSSDPAIKNYYLNPANEERLKGWKKYISEYGSEAQKLSQSDIAGDKNRGKQLVLHITDVVSQVMKKIDQGQDLPASIEELSPNTVKP